MSIRHHRANRVAAAAVAAVLAVALTGCQLVGDALEGQRIVIERVEVARALTALADALSGIDGVESVDVSSGLQVELANTGFGLWDEVVSRIGAAGERDPLKDHPFTVALRSGMVGAHLSTEYGVAGFTEPALQVATDAAAAFAGSWVTLDGGMGSSTVSLSVPERAESVLARLGEDPAVVRLLEDAESSRMAVHISADGLDVSGVPGPELMRWAEDLLASGAPRMTTFASTVGDEQPSEWMFVSIARYDGEDSVGGTWGSAAAPGEGGAMWDAFVAALRAGPPHAASGDGCVQTYLSYSWPGMGNSAMAVASCGAPAAAAGSPDRPALATLRAALAAEGIDLEQLGFVLG